MDENIVAAVRVVVARHYGINPSDEEIAKLLTEIDAELDAMASPRPDDEVVDAVASLGDEHAVVSPPASAEDR